jgi:cytochrome o ubiquinol oxidase subunit IV
MKNYFEEIGLWPRSEHVAAVYVTGFVLSLILTFAAYAVAAGGTFSGGEIALVVAILAVLQFAVQVYCFLHVGKEAGSRDRLLVLGWAIVIVGILVSGSLWIMYSLNGRMMPDQTQMEQYMNDQLGF